MSSWLAPFEKHALNPVLRSCPERTWESGAVYNPAAITWQNAVWLLYRAEDVPVHEISETRLYTGRFGLARSHDGVHFERVQNDPVLGPGGPFAALKTRGVEDPRLVQMLDGRFLLTYTAFCGTSLYDWAPGRIHLFLAESRDLVHWKEHGPVFSFGAKSAGILPVKIDGRFVMYYGDHDIHLAESPDGVNWTPTGRVVLAPRPGFADDGGVEVGPPPLLTKHGILLIYNMISAKQPYEYAVGYALLDRHEPWRVLERGEQPILRGEHAWERSRRFDESVIRGAHVLFASGAAILGDRFFLYYGCGDETVCVASTDWSDAR